MKKGNKNISGVFIGNRPFANIYVGNKWVDTSLDPDARVYIEAVEAADGEALELGYRKVISQSMKKLEAGGIREKILYFHIRAGARTLAGSLIPLIGPTPTNLNYVSGDYQRKNGLSSTNTQKGIRTNLDLTTLTTNTDVGFSAVISQYKGADQFKFLAGSKGSGITNRIGLTIHSVGLLSFRDYASDTILTLVGDYQEVIDVPVTGNRLGDVVSGYINGVSIGTAGPTSPPAELYSNIGLDGAFDATSETLGYRSNIPIKIQVIHKALSSVEVATLHEIMTDITNAINSL